MSTFHYHQELSATTIISALDYLDANCNHDEWIKLGMAVHSWDDGRTGFNIWDNWSSKGQTYDAKQIKHCWRSFKSKGKITVATLLKAAVNAGWKFPEETIKFYDSRESIKDGTKEVVHVEPHIEMPVKTLVKEPVKTDTKKKTDIAMAGHRFQQFKTKYIETSRQAPSNHPYLVRKNIKPHGLRVMNRVNPYGSPEEKFEYVNALVVPLGKDLNPNGTFKIDTVQFISPSGKKKNFYGLPKSGRFHILFGDSTTIYLSEGFATASTIHEKLGNTSVMCIDAKNLPKAAQKLKRLYRNSKFVVAADNDRDGLKYAKKAARLIGAKYVYPKFPNGKHGTDFNDLANL